MNGIHACKIKIKFIQSIILLFTNMSYFRFVYHDMFSIFRLSCLLLSTIGLAVLYVTFQGPTSNPAPLYAPWLNRNLHSLGNRNGHTLEIGWKSYHLNKSREKGSVQKRQTDSTVESESYFANQLSDECN